MKQNKGRKIFWTTQLAAVVFAMFLLTTTINFFRSEIFEVTPGNAANNFGFNVSFFIPMTFLILIGCIVVVFGTLFTRKKRPKVWQIILPLALTLPIIGLFLFQVFRIFSN